jgi:hypothetical protein
MVITLYVDYSSVHLSICKISIYCQKRHGEVLMLKWLRQLYELLFEE